MNDYKSKSMQYNYFVDKNQESVGGEKCMRDCSSVRLNCLIESKDRCDRHVIIYGRLQGYKES